MQACRKLTIAILYTDSNYIGGQYTCATPNGYQGDLLYSNDNHVLQYCEGKNWRATGPVPGAGGAGCSTPAGAEGNLLYNDTAHVYQYCDGTNWIATGKQVIPPAGSSLIGWWKLDENSGNAADSSGYNHPGTPVNSPTWYPSGGKDGGAIYCTDDVDGNETNDRHLDIGTSFDIPAVPFTISVWVNPTDYNDWRTIFGKRDAGANTRFQMMLNISDGVVWLRSDFDSILFAYSPSTGAWTLLTIVASATDTKLYVNGVLQETLGTFALGVIGAARTNICDNGEVDSGGTDSDPFLGYLDDVRVYSRALAAGEIADIYVSTHGSDCVVDPFTFTDVTDQPYSTVTSSDIVALSIPLGCSLTVADMADTSSGLIHWWKLDEAPGATTAVDSIGGANVTLAGTAAFTTGGINGNALDLPDDGTEKASNVASSPADILGKSTLTMSMWFKRAALNTYVQAGQEDFAASGNEIAIEAYSDGRLYFSIGAAQQACGRVTLNDTAWHMATLVFDGSLTGDASRLKGYIDGTQQQLSFTCPGAVPAATTSTARPFYIGDMNGGQGYQDAGAIDDVRIYDRALSAAEITGVYNAASTAKYRLCSDGTCSDDPAFGTASQAVSPGQYVQAQVTTDTAGNTPSNARVTVGSTSDTFTATTIPVIKRVFVTSLNYATNGNVANTSFNSYATASTRCGERATAAALGGTWKAWISDKTAANDPDSLFTGVGGLYRYQLVTGTKVADDWADLTDATLDNAIDRDESGTLQSASNNVWTNVSTAGANNGTTNNSACGTAGGGWLSIGAGVTGRVGRSNSATGTWTASSTAACNTTKRLYCFEQ